MRWPWVLYWVPPRRGGQLMMLYGYFASAVAAGAASTTPNIDQSDAAALRELNHARDLCKQRIVLASADIRTGHEACSVLANQDTATCDPSGRQTLCSQAAANCCRGRFLSCLHLFYVPFYFSETFNR